MKGFVPLNIETDRSIREDDCSILRAEDISTICHRMGYDVFGVNDKFSISYLVPACKGIGRSLIVGTKIELVHFGTLLEVSIYARNLNGNKVINKILRNHPSAKITDHDTVGFLLDSENIIKVICTKDPRLWLRPNLRKSLSKFHCCYIGITSLPNTEAFKAEINAIGSILPAVAFPRFAYMDGEKNLYRVMLAIKHNTKIDMLVETPTIGLMPKDKIHELYKKWEILLENTRLISQKISYAPIEKPESISYRQRGLRETKYEFIKSCITGLCERGFNKERFDSIRHEMGIIVKKSFQPYFLLVRDIAYYCRENSIILGPRGSGAGAMTSYLLYITEIDPQKYNLLFERFLREDRLDFPDYDMDFPSDRRDDIINFMLKSFPNFITCHICSYGKMKAKMAIRLVGKACGMSAWLIDQLAKSVIYRITEETDLKNREKQSGVHAMLHQYPELKESFEYASQIQGISYSYGQHAAGLVLVPKDKVDEYPIVYFNDRPVFMSNMNELKFYGLLKIDILGVDALSIISYVLRERSISIESIPIDQPETIKSMKRGSNLGIFQVTHAISTIIKRSRLESIIDISNIISLYRPGSMHHIDTYVSNSHDSSWKDRLEGIWRHPLISKVLEETYGIIIYQEQIMKIVMSVAGYSAIEAENLRKIISKKILSLMPLERSKLIKGATSTLGESGAALLYDEISRFKSYGFNKSHGVAYAHNSYYMAYLKRWYPEHYICAIMIYDHNEYNRAKAFYDAIELGINIRRSRTGEESWDSYVKDGEIILGWSLLKGCSKHLFDKISRLNKESQIQNLTYREKEMIRLYGMFGTTTLSERCRAYNFDPDAKNHHNDISLNRFLNDFIEGTHEVWFRVTVTNIIKSRSTMNAYDNLWIKDGNVICFNDGTYTLSVRTTLNLEKIKISDTIELKIHYSNGRIMGLKILDINLMNQRKNE